MDFDLFLEQMTELCTALAQNEEIPEDKKIDMDAAWKLILDIAKENRKEVQVILPLVSLYATHNPEIKKPRYQCCEDDLAALRDTAKSLDDRLKYAGSLLSYITILNDDLAFETVCAIIDLADAWIKEHPESVVPGKVLELFEHFIVEDIAPENLKRIVDKLKEAIGGPQKAAAIFLMAMIAHDIMEIDEEEFPVYIMGVIENGLKDSEHATIIASAYLMAQLGAHWAHCCAPEHAPSKDSLLEWLVPVMLHQDPIVSKNGHKAFRELIAADLFNDPAIAHKLIDELYPKYDKDHIRMFFKAMITFVYPDDEDDCESDDDDDEGVSLEIVEPIVDLLKKTVKDESDLVAALSLDAIADLAYKDKMYVDDMITESIAVAEALIAKNAYSVFEYVANFMIGMFGNFKEDTLDKVIPMVPKVLAQLNNPEVGNLKHRIYTAAALSQIVAEAARDHVPTLLKFVVDTLETSDDETTFLLCTVMVPMKACFDEQTANAVFKKLTPKIRETQDEEFVASWCHILAKLLKRHTIEQEAVASLVSAILAGELKSLHGRPPHKATPPNTAIFAFLACYIKKSPSSGRPICVQLIEWLGLTGFPSIPALLIPLKAAISVGIVDEELAGKLAPLLKAMLKKFDTHDIEELVAVVGVLAELYNHQPKVLQPVSELIEDLQKFVAAANIEEEEDIDDELGDLVEAMPTVCQFVFGVYASNDCPDEVNYDVLGTLITMLPFPPQVEEMPDLLEQLCSILEDTDKFKPVVLPTLAVFVEMLLMKSQELEEYELSDELIKDMKSTLKTCVKEDRKLEVSLSKPFKNQKAKLNRFKALLR